MSSASARAPGLPAEARINAGTGGKEPYPLDANGEAYRVFLVPDIGYDQGVIKGYLKKKYSGIPPEMITSQVNMSVMANLANLEFVVCVRRGIDGEPGPAYTVETVETQSGTRRREVPIPPETYHNEVYESAPIRVRDHVKIEKVNLFRATEPQLGDLINVLCAHAMPHRITPQNKPDMLLRFVVGH